MIPRPTTLTYLRSFSFPFSHSLSFSRIEPFPIPPGPSQPRSGPGSYAPLMYYFLSLSPSPLPPFVRKKERKRKITRVCLPDGFDGLIEFCDINCAQFSCLIPALPTYILDMNMSSFAVIRSSFGSAELMADWFKIRFYVSPEMHAPL